MLQTRNLIMLCTYKWRCFFPLVIYNKSVLPYSFAIYNKNKDMLESSLLGRVLEFCSYQTNFTMCISAFSNLLLHLSILNCLITNIMYIVRICSTTVFALITARAPISAQSSTWVVFTLQSVYFYLPLYKTYVVGTHLNCLDKSRQFKRVPQHMLLWRKSENDIA